MLDLSHPRCAALEVALFGEASGSSRRYPESGSGGRVVAGHLKHMGARRVEAVVARHPRVGFERREQCEAGSRSSRHRDGHGAVERDHRVVRDALQQTIKGEYL